MNNMYTLSYSKKSLKKEKEEKKRKKREKKRKKGEKREKEKKREKKRKEKGGRIRILIGAQNPGLVAKQVEQSRGGAEAAAEPA